MYIYIYIWIRIYIYISPKIYLLGSGYVLDIPCLTAYIITCWSSCSPTAGKYLFRRECRYKTMYTHLLRNILSNYWCGMHHTCKNTSVNLTGTVWMIRSEKLCEGNLSTSLLEGFTGSDAAQSDCENRTVGWYENSSRKRHAGSWLGRSPFQKLEKLQVRFHNIMDGSSLARAIHVPTGPLLS